MSPSPAPHARRARVGAAIEWGRAIPAVAAFGGLTAIGLSDGGLSPRVWRLSMLALLALAAAAIVGRVRLPLGRRDWIVIVALSALAAWTAAARFWSELPSASLLEAERTLLYAVCVAAVLLGVEAGAVLALLAGALAGITAVTAYGLVDYIVSRPPLDPFQGQLLFEPFGYANAVGIFSAVGILLSAGLALAARARSLRIAALAPLVVLGPTLYLTSSRGAWIALPVGLAVVLYVGGRIGSRVALAALLAAGMAGGILLGSRDDQTLSIIGKNRPQYWSVAWKDVEEHPLLGSGPGTFGNFFLNHRKTDEYAHDAHNLYLESLAELGPVGLLLVAIGLGTPLLALVGRRGDPVAAAAAGGYTAFVLHAGVDWDWEWPAVTLAGLLCGSALLAAARSPRAPGIPAGVRVTALAALLAVAAFVLKRLVETESFSVGS